MKSRLFVWPLFAAVLVVAPAGAQTEPAERPPWADEASLETEDEPPPPSARTNLLITGAATTLGFYGLGFGTSYLWPSSPVAEDLRLPVVGAYSAVFGAGCGRGERTCSTFTAALRTTLAALSALGQTGGVLLLGEALFMDTRSSSASTSAYSSSAAALGAQGDASAEAAPQSQPRAPSTEVYYAPVVDEHSVGFFIGGTF